MDEQMIALGRRAVACKGWRWMPGMLASGSGYKLLHCIDFTSSLLKWEGSVRVSHQRHGHWCSANDEVVDTPTREATCLPDLTDPATLGCLLALVREAIGDDGAGVARADDGRWYLDTAYNTPTDDTGYPSEAETLIAALEAAS